jgi:hypothetical protein
MPKKPPHHNPGNRAVRTVQSAATLLQRISIQSGAVATTLGTDSVAIGRLCSGLPETLRAHVVGCVEKVDELVLLVESAAWAGRVKLALADLPPREDPRKLSVRVMPRATTARMDRYDSPHDLNGKPHEQKPAGTRDPKVDAGRPAPGPAARGSRRG